MADDADNVVPFKKSPPDTVIDQYLSELFLLSEQEAATMMNQLIDAREYAKQGGWPDNFAFGQLINKLRTELKEDLVHMLAAMMWGEVLNDERRAQER